MNPREQKIWYLFPRQYVAAMSSITLVELKAKYKINGVKVDKTYNIVANIRPSAYYPTGKSIVLCKLCDDMIYNPDAGEWVYFSDIEEARDLLLRCVKASCTTASFGCCSKYEECSNKGQCVHENPFYSLGCVYRSRLESGSILYGENCNI